MQKSYRARATDSGASIEGWRVADDTGRCISWGRIRMHIKMGGYRMPKSSATGKLKARTGGASSGTRRQKRAPTPEELENLRQKVEAAKALGLWEQVESHGWGSLTAAESGRIGGYMTRLRFQARRTHSEGGHAPNAQGGS